MSTFAIMPDSPRAALSAAPARLGTQVQQLRQHARTSVPITVSIETASGPADPLTLSRVDRVVHFRTRITIEGVDPSGNHIKREFNNVASISFT